MKKAFFIIAIFSIAHPIYSQTWRRVDLIGEGSGLNAIFWGDTGLVLGGGVIYHTNDFFNSYYVDSTFQPNPFEGGLSFHTREIGYITDSYVQGGLLTTVDGGNTWLPVASLQDELWGNLLMFTSPNIGYGVYSDITPPYFNYSHDSGVTWNMVSINLPPNRVERISRFSVMRDSIMYALCNSDKAPESVGNYNLIKSTDTGSNWQLVYFTPKLSVYAEFHFLDDTTIIMSISNMILKSTDAGVTFDTVMYSPSLNDIYAESINSISFVGHDTGFVAFPYDVYRTYDAGDTWVKTSFAFDSVTANGSDIAFIYAVNSQKIVVGCLLGQMFITTTGGGIATGVQEINNNYQFSIYPNPATNQLLISASGFQPQTITIYNLNGQLLINLPFAREVDISTLPSSVYFVEVTGVQGTEVRKLVKEY